MNKNQLVSKIILSLEDQGFSVNGHVVPSISDKESLKLIQSHSKREQIQLQKTFLIDNFNIIQKFSLNSRNVDVKQIRLELRIVKEGTVENSIYRWWNLAWWSVPYQRAYGRQMRFILWDITHDAPFGLIGLQSPILKMAVRDKYLNISFEKLDTIINKSMQAQRLGALPPYNRIIGGKMVALSITSNEIRKFYSQKYKDRKTILMDRVIQPHLLFITTTSAFGKSSIYNRLKYRDELVGHSLGFTRGAGTFHISEEIYKDLQRYLLSQNVEINTSFGYGPSRKVKLIDKAFSLLDLNEYHYHNIKREFFLFPLAKNLQKVIDNERKPVYFDRPIDELVEWWKYRWAIKRSQTDKSWSSYSFDNFIATFENENNIKF